MHPHFRRLILAIGLLLPALLPAAHAADAGPRAAAWKSVEDALRQGQPRTALERLQPILEAAQREQAWPEAAKAIAQRIQLETEVEGRVPWERIHRYRNALTNAPAPLHPVLHTLTAHAWWTYFQQNRWRIQQRTAGTESGDFLTWDLRRVFAEIQREHELALTNAAVLQRIPIGDWEALIPRGTIPDRQRPTLFDFLSHEAIAFHASGEQAGARPEDDFVLSPESPVFGTPEEFLAWRPNLGPSEADSAAYRAIRAFQDLLVFHRNDPEPSAFLDADLERIRFAANAAAAAGRDARHEAALRASVSRAGRHELGAMARMDLTHLLQRLERLGEAHALATETSRQFPGTPGAKLATNFLASIEARSLTLETERIWSAPLTPISVAHRNVPQVWFRLVPVDWDSFLDRRQPRPENMNPRQRLEYLRRPAALEWSARLPSTNAWSTAVTQVPPPSPPPPAGFYFLFASARADFSETDNQLAATQIWVSDLALVLRPRAGRLEGFVLDALTGEPLPGATVDAWHLDDQRTRVRAPSATTDAMGFFSLTPPRPVRGQLVRARIGNRQIASEHEMHAWDAPIPSTEGRQTLFFTDRALYRPGQSIQYKGICIRHRGDEPTYDLLPGESVTVVFNDPNGRELARATHRANDYGSFSGTFTAPRDTLTGGMTLVVQSGPSGATQVTVEEYKRPKFQVTLDAPAQPARLAAPVQIAGRATAYTGAAIDGGKVSWRVTRKVRLPPWCRWFHFGRMPQPGDAQAIAHGSTTTRADGSFDITFPAIPDPSVPESNEPSFTFEIHADVTDAAGETRSGERDVTVGYAAMAVELTADEWQEQGRPVRLKVRSQSLDEAPLPGHGTLRVHRVRQPDRILRHQPDGRRHTGAATAEPTDPNTWPLAELVLERAIVTPATDGRIALELDLPAGLYRATAEIADTQGRPVTARLPLRVLDPKSARLNLTVPQVLAAPTWEVLPDQEFRVVWGTGYESGRAFVEIEHRNRLVERFWTEPGRTQQEIRRRVDRAHRGGFTLHVTQVRENRAYLVSRQVEVPWRDQELDLRWETFRSRLEPGTRETWTATLQPRIPGTHAGPAELVAALYDASLDQYLRHAWPERFDFWPTHASTAQTHFQNWDQLLQPFASTWRTPQIPVDLRHRAFLPELVSGRFVRMGLAGGGFGGGGYATRSLAMPAAAPAPMADAVVGVAGMQEIAPASRRMSKDAAVPSGAPGAESASTASSSGSSTPSPATVTPRRNLQETAFFLPHVVADSNGVVRLSFTMPEALTEWRFLGFAHDRALRSGSLAGRTVTARDLMVQPNPPRFLREGDELEFTVKLSNSASNALAGRARLEFAFAHDDRSADTSLGNRAPEQSFEIPAKASHTLHWRIQVPDGCGFLRYKATAATDRTADGEEGWLPVLTRRIHVTESLPVPIRGPGSRQAVFQTLAESGRSPGLQHESLTAEVVSQPAWYAVLALPYLMEFPHACSEQVFSRYYANAIGQHLANRDPKIRRIFDQWRATPALASPLEKNPDLKSVALEETPWLRAARDESESRQRIGLFFESDRLEAEQQRALRELTERQLPEGGWSWFPGGPRDEYITLTIVAGFGRLHRLGLQPDLQPALRALESLDASMTRRHEHLREAKRLDDTNLDSHVALHLYARSFYDVPVADPNKAAFSYWLDQARQHWLKVPRQSQAHLALAFIRFGTRILPEYVDLARRIVTSLKEHSVTDPELGRFWRDTEFSASWYRAPIETQALMIEAFADVTQDAAAVEECQVWLIKQKQTQAWKSTRATADAVHALLARGPNLLTSDALATLELGGQPVRPASPAAIEAGTGYYQVRVPVDRVDARLAAITLHKPDAGVAWASVHWQYFQDIEQVKPFAGSPLRVSKTIHVRTDGRAGKTLAPVRGPVRVGDELVVRVELRTDRDLEYVHLKDHRPSGTEPVNVLSGYRFQDGLGYYESTRDTASHFFIGYLPTGTYVFEYPVRVQHRGRFPAGLAAAQCLYAPEFNSHSASTTLEVQ